MSRFLRKPQALFLHIPRTGGEWVENAIRTLDIEVGPYRKGCPHSLPRKHASPLQMNRRARARYLTAFCFVRHPVSYYVSVWRYFRSYTRKKVYKFTQNFYWNPLKDAAKEFSPDFNKWVELMLEKHPLWVTRLFEMYTGPKNGEFCGYIGRTENLLEDFVFIMLELGYENEIHKHWEALRTLEPANQSYHFDLQWNGELKARVVNQEWDIIERFYMNRGKIRYAPANQTSNREMAT